MAISASSQPSERSTSSASYTNLGDQVSVSVGPSGFLNVGFHGQIRSSPAGLGVVSVFLDVATPLANDRVNVAVAGAVPGPILATTSTATPAYRPFYSHGAGMAVLDSSIAYTGDVLPQLIGGNAGAGATLGGLLSIHATPATYNVSLQYRISSASTPTTVYAKSTYLCAISYD